MGTALVPVWLCISYIRKYFPDIEADVYLEDRKPVFDYIDRMDEVKTEAEEDKVYDLFITCDVSALDRLAVARKYFDAAKKTACIDHHVSNNGFADVNHVRGEISSASEVLIRTSGFRQDRSFHCGSYLYRNGT